MRVENAGAAHAHLIAALHAECFEEAWSETSIADLFAAPGLVAQLASIEGEPAGFTLARTVADEAEVLSIGVRPGFRGQKIGAALLTGLHGFLQETRAASIVFLDCAADNLPALALYAGAGYEIVGRRRGYYKRPGAQSVDSLTMKRVIR